MITQPPVPGYYWARLPWHGAGEGPSIVLAHPSGVDTFGYDQYLEYHEVELIAPVSTIEQDEELRALLRRFVDGPT